MARVSRMAAARSGSGSSSSALASQRSASIAERGGEAVDPTMSLYPSINSLRSEQKETDFSCKDCYKTALSYIYDYTIASCVYSACQCFKKDKDKRLNRNDSTVSVEDMEISEMKEKLKFHFMNPFQKWRYEPRRRFPWKLIVQLFTMILVTLQLVLFAQTKFALTDFIRENTRTFANLFVKHPVDTFTQNVVPIPSPISFLYTMDDVLEQINFTVDAYFNLRDGAVGTYGYDWSELDGDADDNMNKGARDLVLKVTRFEKGKIDPTSRTFNISGDTRTMNYTITPEDVNCANCSIADAIDWDKLVKDMNVIKTLKLNFTISSVYVDHSSTSSPRGICFQFDILFTITNEYRTGNMPVTLTVKPSKSDCRDDSTIFQLGTSLDSSPWVTVLDCIVILISFVSMVQCLRSLINSWHLAIIVRKFFVVKFDNFRVRVHHLLPLFNFWHVGVIVSNVLVIIGSLLKMLISYNVINNIELVDITSIILGLAVFGQWCGLLRFLSYFDKYNMLLLTLRISAPSVLRFIICTGILYIAFLLCGWLVMGPYHPKFRTPSIASECLFSLVNGDDMYNTFIMMSDVSQAAWIFSKIYLYIFIALFIYVVLSVFISLISDTYETLHEHWRERSKGLLEDFATGKLGRAKPQHTHTHSLTSIVNEDEDYDLLRDITKTTSYGAMDHTLVINGGPEISRTPPSYKQHLTALPTLHLRKEEAHSTNNTDQYSDEGEESGTENSSQPMFKLDDS